LGRCWSGWQPALLLLLLVVLLLALSLLLLLFLLTQKSFEHTVQRVLRGLQCAACATLVASLLPAHYPYRCCCCPQQPRPQ
jgi:chromate transport protein ChrA